MSYREPGHISSQRKAVLRGLATDLLINERTVTTEARAKGVHSAAEKIITLGKRGDLYAHRQAAVFVRNEVVSVRGESKDITIESALQKLFDDIAPRYAKRQGGYTHILKTEPRRGDGTLMVILELV